MSQVFHDIEKKIIRVLKEKPKISPEKLEEETGLSTDQIRRGIEWLKLKNFLDVSETKKTLIKLGKNGLESKLNGLPEKQLLDLLKNGPKQLQDLQKEMKSVFGPAMGIARKNNWIKS